MSDIIVQVEQGKLRGKQCVDYKNGIYYSFYGIPYALPPLGSLRFKSPLPPEKWTGIRDATSERDGCISRHTITFEIVGTEDCLFLNVYTPEVRTPLMPHRVKLPKSTNNTLKPVMVWLHGGAYSTGSTSTELFGPDFLISEDVVIVTVSFRLGFLGFMCLEDPSLRVPGNGSFRDIIMALKWVQTNISNFMGDPNNVTLFGESSGGVSAHYILLSPLGQGLFHKAILQSASTLMHWARGNRDGGKKLANLLGCNSENERDILEFLQKVPIDILFEARDKMKSPISPSILRNFCPVIEKVTQIEPPVIAAEPLEIILKGNYNKMPLIMGYTSEEGMFFEPIIRNKEFLVRNFEEMIPHVLKLTPGSFISKLTAEKIKKFYFGNDEPTAEHIRKYFHMQSDNYFSSRIVGTVKYHMNNLGHPIYLYRFSVDASLNIYKKLINGSSPGATHTDDVPYLFKMSLTPNIKLDSVEDKTIKRMITLWANFARYGDPNPRKEDPLITVKWKPAKKGLLHFLDIGEELTAGVNPEGNRIYFWDEIYNLDPLLAKL